MKHSSDPERYPAPVELVLCNHLGDGRMLIQGGLLDQPVQWFAVQYAGFVQSILKRSKEQAFKLADIKPDEMELYLEIAQIQSELSQQVSA